MRTLLDIRTEVIEDLDLQDSDLVSSPDIDRWVNKGIRLAQAEILGIHEPYFLSYSEIAITSPTDIYDYPADIYANKIKSMVFSISSLSTSAVIINRIHNMNKASTLSAIYSNGQVSNGGGWIPLNTLSGGRKIQLIPTPRSGTLKIWYIRNAKNLVLDTDVCDIDEFEDYVIAYTKMKALQKDSNPMFVEAKEEESSMKRLMIDTLNDMVLDWNDNKLEADTSFYESQQGEF